MQMYAAIFRLLDPVEGSFILQMLTSVICMCGVAERAGTKAGYKHDRTSEDPYHSAVGHGALGFAGTLGALPPLWVSVRRLADLKDIPGRSGAIFAPIRCRTHAYTSTNKQPRCKRVSSSYTPPPDSTTFLFLPHRPAPPGPYAKFPSASDRLGFVLLLCLSPLAFHASTAGEGADLFFFPDEPQSAEKSTG